MVMALLQPEWVRRMDDLPDESFALILDLVPIREIFVLMRVSKRWAAACRFIVRTRQSLSIGIDDWYEENASEMRGWDWHRDRPSEPLDKITVANESLVPAMMKSVNQMENIRRLCVYDIDTEVTSPFVRKFADQLTLLEVDFAISDVGSDVFLHLTHLKCSLFKAKTAAAFPKLTELVIVWGEEYEELPDIVLPSLKRLLIVGLYGDEWLKEFILTNATNLEFLSAAGFRMGFDRVVVFPNVTDIHCKSMDVDMVKAFPSIRRLTMQREIGKLDFLKRLPAAQMLGLDIRLFFHSPEYDGDDEDNEAKVMACGAVFGAMSNLRELSITVDLVSKLALCSIFKQFHQLEKVSISINNFGIGVFGDNIMFPLVQQNQNLRAVRLRGMYFSSAAYASLGKLHHLSHFSLDQLNSSTHRKRDTTDDVLTLLRGSPRKVIRKLTIWELMLDVDRVTREIELMAQERGTTFDKSEDRSYLDYVIHA